MYDTIIIGSGPAGLSAAVYAKRAQLNAVVVEKEYMGTGQIAESERVDNYLGLYGESGFDLGEKFREHAVSLGAQFYEGEAVKIVPEENFYNIFFSDDKSLRTKTVIYAAGANPRKLNIKGEVGFTGKGVSYCAVCDGAFYKNKTVAVIGGGDTALQDAILLSKTAETVYLIHRRDEFRANKTLQKTVMNTQNIKLILNAVPDQIIGDKKVTSIKVLHNNQEEVLDVDGVFVAIGTVPNSKLLEGVAILDDNNYVIADENGITSANGIFVAGDVRTKQLRQVVTAVSDGANCVMSAENYISNLGE
ncbi:MAG: FAD-dependent oxidoreductase [Ruminococcus sp.]|nr:FAD-dependent oxidoreductase [Ruminococcus sp.]